MKKLLKKLTSSLKPMGSFYVNLLADSGYVHVTKDRAISKR
jgi:hypothetical protein